MEHNLPNPNKLNDKMAVDYLSHLKFQSEISYRSNSNIQPVIPSNHATIMPSDPIDLLAYDYPPSGKKKFLPMLTARRLRLTGRPPAFCSHFTEKAKLNFWVRTRRLAGPLAAGWAA
jgi:hypothetical protein